MYTRRAIHCSFKIITTPVTLMHRQPLCSLATPLAMPTPSVALVSLSPDQSIGALITMRNRPHRSQRISPWMICINLSVQSAIGWSAGRYGPAAIINHCAMALGGNVMDAGDH
jgi:hypothetical protein